MRRLVVNLLGLCLVVAFAGNAAAGGVVHSGTRGFEKLQKGLFQVGFDNMLLVNYSSSTDDGTAGAEVTSSLLSASWIGGLAPRYFIMNNFSLGLSLNFFYELEKQTTEVGGDETSLEKSDTGFIGFVTANYHVRLGNSLFLRPGIGVGYFMGTREVPFAGVAVTLDGQPSGGSTKVETSLSGMAAQLDLTLEYFASAHFSMRAGPVIMMRFGTETPEGADEGNAYQQVDAGFIGGLGYSF